LFLAFASLNLFLAAAFSERFNARCVAAATLFSARYFRYFSSFFRTSFLGLRDLILGVKSSLPKSSKLLSIMARESTSLVDVDVDVDVDVGVQEEEEEEEEEEEDL